LQLCEDKDGAKQRTKLINDKHLQSLHTASSACMTADAACE